MAKLAFMTIGLLHEHVDSPRSQGFVDRIEAVFAAADVSDGFITRPMNDETTGNPTWGGTQQTPAIFPDEEVVEQVPTTLSLWQDLESVFAYAYNGLHAEALSKRKTWFVKPEWPSYAAWWVDDTHLPSWPEACTRYDRLEQIGPSPEAFNFKRPFGPDGQPVKINWEAVRRKAAQQKKG